MTDMSHETDDVPTSHFETEVHNSVFVAEAAVIFVHGIGKQERGSTLLAGRQCLINAFNEFNEISHSHPDGLEEPWSDLIGVKTEDSTELRLLLVDGWWDDTVTQVRGGNWRSLWRIWFWTVAILPISLLWNAALSMLATSYDDDDNIVDNKRSNITILHNLLWRGIIIPPILLVGVFIGTGLVLADRALARNAKLKMFRIEPVAQKVIGDAWAFAASLDHREQIVDRVRHIVRWAKDRAPVQLVIAHSQGGAVAREVLETLDASALITIGSGAMQLELSRYHSRRPFWLVYGWLFLTTFPLLVAYLVLVIFVNSLPGIFTTAISHGDWLALAKHIGIWFAPAITAVIVIGLIVLVFNTKKKTAQAKSVAVPKVGYWGEVISRYDLVCTGGSLIMSDVRPQVIRVVNYSRLRDLRKEHILYLENPNLSIFFGRTIGALVGIPLSIDQSIARPAPKSHRMLDNFWWWGIPVTLVIGVHPFRLPKYGCRIDIYDRIQKSSELTDRLNVLALHVLPALQ